MNILYLAHRIPYPPNKGDKIRAFNEIKFLSRRHTVDVCCLVDTPADERHVEPLKKYCRTVTYVKINAKLKKAFSVLSAIFSGKTCTEIFFHSKKLQRQIDQLISGGNYDIIYIFCSSMASYVRNAGNIARVIDFVDIDSDKWIQYAKYARFPLKWLFKREGELLQKLECKILSWTQASFLVTERETEFFAHLPHGNKVYAIPNGIDRGFFDIDKTPCDDFLAGENYVCFTGAMDYFPNEDAVVFFYENIYPLIKPHAPGLKFYIVGSNPTDKVRKLADDKDVVVTGTVDDIRPYIRHAKISVIPLRMARGIQNKILEAISMGLPVVCTSNAAEGLALRNGIDFYVEDDESKFARRTLELLNNPCLKNEMVRSAQMLIDQFYDWENNLNKMESVMASAVKIKKNAEGGI